MVGETLGSYKIVEKMGEGGMGVVYLAEHALIGRKAAVKLLRPECSSNQEIVQRFFNEARSTAKIRHSGLVDVFDFGYAANGSAYIVMEFLEGESLATRIESGLKFPLEMQAQVGREIAGAVGAAHSKGIVHRDLKPDNVFLVSDDVEGGIRVKVLDFGIAKLAGDVSTSVKTRTGSMMGTPLYMAPEQCRGAGEVDRRADIYALGCILYEMATGRPPFLGDGPGDVMVGHMREAPVPPRQLRPETNEKIEALILRMLAKKPDDRPATMEAVASELDVIVGRVRRGSQISGVGEAITRTGSGSGTGRPPSAASASGLDATAHAPAVAVAALPTARTGGGLAHAPTHATPHPDSVVPSVSSQPTSPPKVGNRTTFGSAAAESVTGSGTSAAPATKTGRGKWIAIGVVAAAALGIGAVALLNPKSKTDRPVATNAPAPQATRIDPPAAPVAKRVKLSITSQPSGADVFRLVDGARIGKTPYTADLEAAAGDAVFVLKLAGHEDARIELPLDRDGSLDKVLTPVAVATTEKTPKPGDKTRKSGKRRTGKGGSTEVKDGTVDPFKD